MAKGVYHAPTLEQLQAFRAIPDEEKLRWLEAMRQTLHEALSPEQKEVMQRFRRGEL
ncbi:MAG: hypothetical protein AAFQ65_07980 [Myxococcota bacterium]